MSKVTIWQCKDECCETKPYSGRYWMARSKDFGLYDDASTFGVAIALTDEYLRSLK
jgi:hypothetical protein